VYAISTTKVPNDEIGSATGVVDAPGSDPHRLRCAPNECTGHHPCGTIGRFRETTGLITDPACARIERHDPPNQNGKKFE